MTFSKMEMCSIDFGQAGQISCIWLVLIVVQWLKLAFPMRGFCTKYLLVWKLQLTCIHLGFNKHVFTNTDLLYAVSVESVTIDVQLVSFLSLNLIDWLNLFIAIVCICQRVLAKYYRA